MLYELYKMFYFNLYDYLITLLLYCPLILIFKIYRIILPTIIIPSVESWSFIGFIKVSANVLDVLLSCSTPFGWSITHFVNFFFPLAVVNLTLIDLPGLTKVAVGKLHASLNFGIWYTDSVLYKCLAGSSFCWNL